MALQVDNPLIILCSLHVTESLMTLITAIFSGIKHTLCFCRFVSIWDLPNLQEFNEPSIVLKFMYHVYQTRVHISNDYKLEDFHFYKRENLTETYQAAWKKYQQALIVFPLEKPRESPPQTHDLHSRPPYNSALNVRRRDRFNGMWIPKQPLILNTFMI